MKLPDELENLFIQLASNLDKNCWQLGDLCIDTIDTLSTVYPKSEIRASIATCCGLAVDTLRDRERVGRKIPREKRLYTLLTYHQYRACLAAGEAWEEYAQMAIESADQYGGRPAPVAIIRAWIRDGGAESPSWLRRWERMQDIAEDLINDPEVPKPIRSVSLAVAETTIASPARV